MAVTAGGTGMPGEREARFRAPRLERAAGPPEVHRWQDAVVAAGLLAASLGSTTAGIMAAWEVAMATAPGPPSAVVTAARATSYQQTDLERAATFQPLRADIVNDVTGGGR